MEALDAISKRRSVRSFLSRPVSRPLLDKIIEAGKAAPSAGGLETQRFIVIEGSAEKGALAGIAFGQKFVAEAPAAIVVLADEKKSKGRYGGRGSFYSVCDGSAAVQNMLVAATALGLGSCWVGAFDDDALKALLKTSLRPIAIIPIGYEG